MHIEHLVKMANDIASFFAGEEDPEVAADAVADHIKRFWEPRMRRQIIEFQKSCGGMGLMDVAQKAVQRLA